MKKTKKKMGKVTRLDASTILWEAQPNKKSSNKKPIAKYVGDAEVMGFKKIINKGDLVPEMSIDEARLRKDFIVINKED